MMRQIFFFATFVSVMIFPWQFSAALALVSAFSIPLLPLASGIFADALYYAPGVGVPLFTLYGALVSGLALFIRSQVSARIIGR